MASIEDKSKQIQKLMKEISISVEKPNINMINYIQNDIINYLSNCKRFKNPPSKKIVNFDIRGNISLAKLEREIKSSFKYVQKLLVKNNCSYLFTFEIKKSVNGMFYAELTFEKNDDENIDNVVEIMDTIKSIEEGAKANEEGREVIEEGAQEGMQEGQ